jgi:AraC-like DNA-binding protein
MVREGLLVSDPVVSGALDGQAQPMSFRTVRHRFLQVTGQSQNRIRQLERVQQAMDLLRQGHSIADVAYQTGYADQPHLTRNIRQLMGVTPAQVAQLAP